MLKKIKQLLCTHSSDYETIFNSKFMFCRKCDKTLGLVEHLTEIIPTDEA